jgi:hypothetical protein
MVFKSGWRGALFFYNCQPNHALHRTPLRGAGEFNTLGSRREMSFWDFLRKSKEVLPPAGSGLLPILLCGNTELDAQYEEDLSMYRETGLVVSSYKTSSVQEMIALLTSKRPELFHLLATFTDRGSLIDALGQELFLNDLMRQAEESGVRLFILASQNNFDHIQAKIHTSRIMNFLTILSRNRHFSTFLKGIVAGLSHDPNFAVAYVKLAPQFEEAQRGLPLPGSIAICPTKKKGGIVLWSEAQP